ncbi:notchless [Anaeramoeba flamelloides]|uniref:Notchless n=1 Tax=Anaeramoeba flamelloides TaxID=1746091 RepID=A0AAV7YYR5_9EUKA|nr:notchless [Anaeramoeba flamelloides]KAJ6255202.1 notchless [Anaeramoeba flamelloides]
MKTAICQFKTPDDEKSGPELDLPLDINPQQLQVLVNDILRQEEELPYSFYVNDFEIQKTLNQTLKKNEISTEQVVQIVYQPQSIFKVRSVTRCTSTLPGHTEAILNVNFGPKGRSLASGSGDTTVRLWDLNTQTPLKVLKAHSNWVLFVCFSPDGKRLATGCMDGKVNIWDPFTGEQLIDTLSSHRKWITYIAWEPFHQNPKCNHLATASKDCTVRVWNVDTGDCKFILAGHKSSITCVKWGGEGLIYTASQDRTIKVWSAKNGKFLKSLEEHGHWVNTMALNTDFVIRTGPFDHTMPNFKSDKDAQKSALKRYDEVKGKESEFLVTGSDDFTMFLWQPKKKRTSIKRMIGHRQLINQVCFSPNGRIIASASFDKSIKLWDGKTGNFLCTLFGHVGPVYQVSFSSDSRLLVSSSKDSTVKVWDIKTKKLKNDLPGHLDEVFAVDFSPDGQSVASGSKDRLLKIWKN